MKTKITVLENVSNLDAPLVNYLRQLKNSEVTTVYSLQSKAPEKKLEIHQALLSCDVLCVCSSFANEEQLAQFAKMIPNYPNIKEVRILYLYSKPSPGDDRALLYKLNLDIQKSTYKDVVALLDTVKVREVFHVGLIAQKQTFFDKLDWYFDEVDLYYNKSRDMIWHVRPPYITLQGDDMYLDRPKVTVTKEVSKKTTETDALTLPGLYVKGEDMELFKEMMKEFRAVVEHQKESCELRDFGDSATLIVEKDQWLEIMNKYKL